jgi:hypothetical protein
MPMNPRLLRPLARFQAPSSPSDPDFASVSLLLHMDGANGSTAFTDSSNNSLVFTAAENAQISTAEKKFGTGSAFFSSSGSDGIYASTYGSAFNFGSGDFTVEWWWYPLNLTSNAYQLIFSSWHGGQEAFWFGTGNGRLCVSLNANVFNFDFGFGGTNDNSSIALNQWQHCACVRFGNSVKLFVDGVNTDNGTFSGSVDSPSGNIDVGGFDYSGGGFISSHGYVDDLRVTKGVARYTANFTPPTAAHPSQ